MLSKNSVVQANCRTRFTAADFDFIVRALSRSRKDAVSLVSLLTDADTRDSAARPRRARRRHPVAKWPSVHFAAALLLRFDQERAPASRDRGPRAVRLSRLAARRIQPHAALRPPRTARARPAPGVRFRSARALREAESVAGVFPAGAAGRLHAVPDGHVPREHRAPPLAPGRAGLFVLRGNGTRELPRRRQPRGRAPPRPERRVQRIWPSSSTRCVSRSTNSPTACSTSTTTPHPPPTRDSL